MEKPKIAWANAFKGSFELREPQELNELNPEELASFLRKKKDQAILPSGYTVVASNSPEKIRGNNA